MTHMALSRRRVSYVSIAAHCVALAALLRYAGQMDRPTALLWLAALALQFTWSATVGLMYSGRRARRWVLWWAPLPALVAFYCWPGMEDAAGRSIGMLAAALLVLCAAGVWLGCCLSAALRARRSSRLHASEEPVADRAVVAAPRTPTGSGA